ncbi:pectate lyase [Puia sp.]|jgi:PelA/Pel-15E family pectate lyase|uniref:pectate lyase n=1 Tax=Puia sp. TaxID=2045100 RepID=UPI002F3F46C6
MDIKRIATTFVLVTLAAFTPRQIRTTVWLIGDSTMADKEIKAYPETGWGMPFEHFFDSTVTVDNRAKNGRSTKSFIAEGRWDAVLQTLKAGDYVLIQFGHNDEVPTKGTYTPEDQFQKNLIRFIKESRDRNAIPILITPVARRKFDSTGNIQETHAAYAALVRKVAAGQHTPLIDLDTESQTLLQQFGPENSKWLFNYLQPGEHPNYPEGRADDTHFSEFGARRMAEIVLADIRTLKLDLAHHIAHPPAPQTSAAVIDPAPFGDNAGHWYAIFDKGNIINPLPGRPRHQPTEIKAIADNILLFQKNNGGWPKNYDPFAILTSAQKDSLLEAKGQTNTTFDNGSTYNQIAALATAWLHLHDDRYSAAAINGLDFILTAQYRNGGWPQYYPLENNYSRCITFNDGAYEGIMRVLKDVKDNKPQYAFVTGSLAKKLRTAYDKGLECILKTQINDAGKPTAWCQQYDETSLKPAWARKFEPPSICNKESADLVIFLMSIDNPTPAVKTAIENAVAWFRASEIADTRVKIIPAQRMVTPFRISYSDRVVVTDSSAPPIWTRYYELKTHRPLFCNRDSKPVYSLAEVDRERRDGYGWYTYSPQQVLDEYKRWIRITVPTDYKTVQAAFDACTPNTTIFIKAGTYHEKLQLTKDGITLIGEPGTVLTWSDHPGIIGKDGDSINTRNSYSFRITGNDFTAKNITFRNDAGFTAGQAVAVEARGDRAIFLHDSIIGNQDILFLNSENSRQYYRDCYIEGTTDFIFGAATAWFENCHIHSKKNSHVTAASTPRDHPFGFIFDNCILTGDSSLNHVSLGRPWRPYASVTYLHCRLGKHIFPDGWANWNQTESYKTARYAEFEDEGPGANPTARVPWSHQLTPAEANDITPRKVFGDWDVLNVTMTTYLYKK